jgi:steroid delta-isomerase-like uncharacterized protein
MPSETNKTAMLRLWQVLNDEVWPTGNLDAADAFLAPNYVYHDVAAGPLEGREGYHQLIGMFQRAFPDTQFTIEDVLAEGDRVALRWSARGTHTGELMGIPPTGRPVTTSGILISRFENSLVAEEWEVIDVLGILQQIGAVPTPGAVPA